MEIVGKLRLFQNRNVKSIRWPHRGEERGENRRLPNEEVRSLYRFCYISGMIKSARLRWAGRVERIGSWEIHTKF
jgi:hypothetical protein